MKYKETDSTRSFLFQQAHPGRDSEHCWTQSLSASTKTKVILLGNEIVTVYSFLILQTQLKVDLHSSKVFSAPPMFYLCSSFNLVRKKTVHSHMLLITSQLQGLHLTATPENRRSWLTPKTTSPQFKSAQKIMTQPTCSHCSTVRDCPTYCGKGTVRRTKAILHNILP